MKSPKNKRRAINVAEETLQAKGITHLPVDPIKLAESYKIEIFPMEFEKASGALIRSGANFAIAYNTTIDNEGYKNFTVAHELGHYLIGDHPEKIFKYGDMHTSRAGENIDNSVEGEADTFASALLMPESMLLSELSKVKKAGLGAVQYIAKICNTSLLSSALRYMELADEPIAVVLSTNSKIDFCLVSDDLYEVVKHAIPRKGEIIPSMTPSYLLSKETDKILKCEKMETFSNLSDWFEESIDLEIKEDAIGLGSYAKLLTILSVDKGAVEYAVSQKGREEYFYWDR